MKSQERIQHANTALNIYQTLIGCGKKPSQILTIANYLGDYARGGKRNEQ